MVRTVQATWPAPDPLNYLPGYRIQAGDAPTEDGHIGDLLRGINHLHAMGTPPIISQGWPGSVWTETVGALTLRPTYRVPRIDPDGILNLVRVSVYASGDGTAAASVRFRSTGTPANVDITSIGAVGWYAGPGNLQLTFGANGYDDIEIYSAKGAGANTVVRSVHVEYVPLVSPLAAYVAADTWVPHDDLEAHDPAGPDFEPLSSRLLRQAKDNLDTLHTRPKVYMMWSGLAGITSAGVPMDYIGGWMHRLWVPVHPGTSTEPYDLTIHINASNPSGPPVDRFIRFQHGFGTAEVAGGRFQTEYTVPAGAATWLTGAAGQTIRLSEPLPDERGEFDWPLHMIMTRLGLWRDGTTDGIRPIDWTPTTDDEARIHSIAVWGR